MGRSRPSSLSCLVDICRVYDGQKQLRNTVDDHDYASRCLIACDALATTKDGYAFTVFERAFKHLGLPPAIRTDKGVPYSCVNVLFGLSRLSAWWLRLRIERVGPGHPQPNGRHEMNA